MTARQPILQLASGPATMHAISSAHQITPLPSLKCLVQKFFVSSGTSLGLSNGCQSLFSISAAKCHIICIDISSFKYFCCSCTKSVQVNGGVVLASLNFIFAAHEMG